MSISRTLGHHITQSPFSWGVLSSVGLATINTAVFGIMGDTGWAAEFTIAATMVVYNKLFLKKKAFRPTSVFVKGFATGALASGAIMYNAMVPTPPFAAPIYSQADRDRIFPTRFHLGNQQLQDCIGEVVKSTMTSAAGRFVPGTERAEGYREFGDMLHYRNRGIFRVDSLSVQKDGTVYASTRLADFGVWPVDVLNIKALPVSWRWDAVDILSRQRTYATSARFGEDIGPLDSFGIDPKPGESTEISAQHTQLIRGVNVCLNGVPAARVPDAGLAK